MHYVRSARPSASALLQSAQGTVEASAEVLQTDGVSPPPPPTNTHTHRTQKPLRYDRDHNGWLLTTGQFFSLIIFFLERESYS